jgi:hypothetical protein
MRWLGMSGEEAELLGAMGVVALLVALLAALLT